MKIDNIEELTYIYVTWPETQELMDQDWFNTEAVLANPDNADHKLYGKNSAYFIPLHRATAPVIDPKEKYLQEFEQRILNSFGDQLTTTFETCKDAPAYGWSVAEYQYMPVIASRLRQKGFTVTSSVNYDVTDWKIAR